MLASSEVAPTVPRQGPFQRARRYNRAPILVNGRFYGRPTTGVERVAASVWHHLQARDDVGIVLPRRSSGIPGHAWEQLVLPLRASGHVLWSPANFGPVLHPRQSLMLYDASPWDHPEWFSMRYQAWLRSVVPIVAKTARSVTTVSNFSKQRLIAHMPFLAGKLSVIRLATQRLYDEADGTLPAGLEAGSFVLTVGTLEPRKNLQRLLEAWGIARRSFSQARLVVVGGSHSLTLKKVTADLFSGGGITVLGHLDDAQLATLYAASAGFVFPSLYEGFGLPPAEAAAYGCRMVVSDIPPLRELLGQGPIYVDPSSVRDISDGLSLLLSDPSSGTVRSLPRRSWAQVADDVYMALRALLD